MTLRQKMAASLNLPGLWCILWMVSFTNGQFQPNFNQFPGQQQPFGNQFQNQQPFPPLGQSVNPSPINFLTGFQSQPVGTGFTGENAFRITGTNLKNVDWNQIDRRAEEGES